MGNLNIIGIDGMVRVCGKGHLVMIFYVGQRVLREWVVGGGGLYGYFGEQELPVGVQECLEGFHRERVDYLTRQFVPKWASPNAERVLKTAGTASLLVDFIGVKGWLCDGGLYEEFQDSRINIKLLPFLSCGLNASIYLKDIIYMKFFALTLSTNA